MTTANTILSVRIDHPADEYDESLYESGGKKIDHVLRKIDTQASRVVVETDNVKVYIEEDGTIRIVAGMARCLRVEPEASNVVEVRTFHR